ncbi:GNAT family N-acetyltransferase [Collimonas sp.]|jgi:GNAT superfamily N-acetyltransferase|uniref:GNAT family N-acetyltransferase n=1 Tax=Collimonas sp. TaxID=1963772 RepID=UPI002BE3B26A|nr:GNAT family N-acetyltransferase [Collimonas sp.]HWW99411.1 GNAT family N-acetyltransferase [Collimonas sp.]
MILTAPELAHILEFAEASHLRRQADAYRTWSGDTRARAVAVCGGVAALTEPAFGRKLNHVTGAGMVASFKVSELAELESMYAAQGLETQIDLCPHAHGGTLALLAERGYAVNAFSNTYVCDLTAPGARSAIANGIGAIASSIEVSGDRDWVGASFAAHSVAGFSVQAVNRPPALLEALAQIALHRDDTRLFAASIDGQIAGTAGMSLIETPAGLLAHLYIASTLPAWRGRGVQLALLHARLDAGRDAGCTLASVTARPANASARNTERAGFSLAYSKATFSKRPPD